MKVSSLALGALISQMNALGFIVPLVMPILAAALLIAVALWLLRKSRESPFPDF
jgi:hypothetical protein